MAYFYCNGRRHELGSGLYRFTVEVNGWVWSFHASRGTCHDAAYMAERAALLLARRMGVLRPVIHSGDPLVTNQMTGRWRARRVGTKRHRALCRAAAVGMRPIYV